MKTQTRVFNPSGVYKRHESYKYDSETLTPGRFDSVNRKSVWNTILSNLKKLKQYLRDKGLIELYYFGACYCGNEGMYFNLGRDHWFHCDKCKTAWWVGSNLFSTWKYENEEIWNENFEQYKDYEEIKGVNDSLERLWVNLVRFVKRTKLKNQSGK